MIFYTQSTPKEEITVLEITESVFIFHQTLVCEAKVI